jgi:hypothetical protein
MFWNKIKIITPTTETEELTSGLKTWMVEWIKRDCYYETNTRKGGQAFVNYEEAVKFKKALEQAYKLIGNTHDNKIELYEQENGL